MEHFAARLDRIITNVGRMPTEFNMEDLNLILGTENEGLEICTSRRELMFNHFLYVNVVRNIRGCSDLSDDICQLSFRNKLIPYCSIITRILHHFILPLYESVYKESKKLGGETISTIGFHRRNEEWVKTTIN